MRLITLATAYAETVEQSSVTAIYNKTFKLYHCSTDILKDQTYRMRASIYCREHGFENPCPKGDGYIERDEYDARSEHFLLRHQVSNEMVGSLRVILPDEGKPEESFPIQKLCSHPVFSPEFKGPKLCEISRFCMAPRFRQRNADGKFLSSYHAQEKEGHRSGHGGLVRRRISYPQAALLQGAFEAAMKNDILDCLWMVEKAHLPSLDTLGFMHHTLGGEVDLYGGMQPVIFNIKHVLDSMRHKAPACWEIVSDQGRLQDMADELSRSDWQKRVSQAHKGNELSAEECAG